MKINLNDLKVISFLNKIYSIYPFRSFNKLSIEQISYRMYLCEKCIAENKCLGGCGCDVYSRISEPTTCNENKFPDMFKDEKSWIDFKQKNNIEII